MNTTKKAILMICVLVLALVLATVVMADFCSNLKASIEGTKYKVSSCNLCTTCYSPGVSGGIYKYSSIDTSDTSREIVTGFATNKKVIGQGSQTGVPIVEIDSKTGKVIKYYEASGKGAASELNKDEPGISEVVNSQDFKDFVLENTESTPLQLTAAQKKDPLIQRGLKAGLDPKSLAGADKTLIESAVKKREYINTQAALLGIANPGDRTKYPDTNALWNDVTKAAAKRARDTGIITEKRYQELTRDDAKAESWKKLNSWYQSTATQKSLKETTDWATIGLSATPPASVYTVAQKTPDPSSQYADKAAVRDGQIWEHDDKGKPINCLSCEKIIPAGLKAPTEVPRDKFDPDRLRSKVVTLNNKDYKFTWNGKSWNCASCDNKKFSDPKALAKWKKSQAALYKKAKPIYDDVVIKNSLVTKEDAQKLLKQGDAGLAKLKTAGLVGQKASSIGANPNEVYTYCSKTKECSSATLGVDPARGDFKIYAGGKTADGVKFQADTGWECVSCAATGEGAEELGVKKPCYPKCTDAEMYAEDAVFKDKSGRLMKSEGYEPFKDSTGTEYKSMDECRSKSKDKKSCSGGFQGYKAVEYYWVPGSWTDILQGGPTVNIMKSFGTFFPKWKDPFGYGSWFDTHFNLEQSTQTQVCKAAFDVESEGVGISPTGSAIPTVSIQGIKNKVEPCIGLRGDSKTACLEFNNLTTSKDYYWNYKITGKVIPKDCNMKFNIFIDTVAMYDKPRELKKGDAPFDLTGAGAIVTKNAAVPADAGRICIRFDDLNAGCLLTKLMHENADGNHRLICNKIRDADVNEEWKDAGFDSFVDFGDDLDTTSSSTTEGCTLC